MTPPPDDLLRHLCRKALELPSAARAAFVANKCRGDAELSRQLAALLVAAGDESFRGEAAAPATPPRTVAAPQPPLGTRIVPLEGPGTVIGPYHLRQLIGEGGFGSVFLAEQSAPVQRQVALKIVKLGMDTAQVVARFEQERQALAVMDHPHIAKVLDAGATATGRPFFVMELCRGEPLTDYCDKNRLSIPDRLALFEQVCRAVQHAHGKGIIHRDLKPSNVLVGNQDGGPQAKIIDFGIAKATVQPLTDRTLFTAAHQVIGTLQYMSPEQAEGALDIDTRTDVYALGAILYELLAGSTPFDRRTFHGAALNEMHRMIREVEPHKPSTRIGDSKAVLATIAAQRRTEERRLPALVRGELDWIVMKAIEKDRTRRYATAIAFAEDVARFRRGEPVEAAPPSAAYRFRKFLHRHRGPVIAAALVFVALLAGITGTAWGLFEAREQEELARQRADAATEERQRADVERDRAVRYRNRALDALRATTGEDVAKLIGSRTELSARERAYLDAIALRWATFSQQAGEDVESRELRAEGLAQIAELRATFGDGARVRAQFEESLSTWQRLHEEYPDEVRYERELLRTRLAFALHLGGRDDELAVAQYRTAREHADRLVARFADSGFYRALLANAHVGIAWHLRKVGQHRAARAELERAAELQQQLVNAFPDDVGHGPELAHTRGELALLLTHLGEREQALREYEAIRALQLSFVARSPDDEQLRAEAANSLQNVANLLAEIGQTDRAKREYRTAIDERQRLVADFPLLPENQRTLARAQTSLGALLVELGEHEAARIELTAARERLQRLVGSGRDVADGDLARNEYRMAMLAANLGEHARAIELYETARDRLGRLSTLQPSVIEHQQELADTLVQLGILLIGARRLDDAETAFVGGREHALRLVAALPGNDKVETLLANAHNSLGLLYKQRGLREDARAELEAARDVRLRLATRAPSVPTFQTMLGGSHCNVGNVLMDVDPAAALLSFDAAVTVLQAVLDRNPSDAVARQFLCNSVSGRGRAHTALGQWAEVAADWDLCASLYGPKEKGWFEWNRALARARAGQSEQAIAEADALAESTDATGLVFAARVHAIAAAAAAGDVCQRRCDRAMALLQAAVQAEWRDAATLADDADFAPLRDRDDFRRLVTGSR